MTARGRDARPSRGFEQRLRIRLVPRHVVVEHRDVEVSFQVEQAHPAPREVLHLAGDDTEAMAAGLSARQHAARCRRTAESACRGARAGSRGRSPASRRPGVGIGRAAFSRASLAKRGGKRAAKGRDERSRDGRRPGRCASNACANDCRIRSVVSTSVPSRSNRIMPAPSGSARRFGARAGRVARRPTARARWPRRTGSASPP